MTLEASLTTEIISEAESYDGIRAGIVRLEDVLHGPSYQVTPKGPGILTQLVRWDTLSRWVSLRFPRT